MDCHCQWFGPKNIRDLRDTNIWWNIQIYCQESSFIHMKILLLFYFSQVCLPGPGNGGEWML